MQHYRITNTVVVIHVPTTVHTVGLNTPYGNMYIVRVRIICHVIRTHVHDDVIYYYTTTTNYCRYHNHHTLITIIITTSFATTTTTTTTIAYCYHTIIHG